MRASLRGAQWACVSAAHRPPIGQEKRPCPGTGPDDWAEAKSKVGQRAREEDMRSAGEPGSREEDTIPVRCRDTRSEGGGYGARLSDSTNMNSIGPVDNTGRHMSAMQLSQRLKKECGPARGGSGATSVAGTSSRKEGTQQEQGRRRSACCAGGDIGRELPLNNRAGDMEAMREVHVIWNKRFESMTNGLPPPLRSGV